MLYRALNLDTGEVIIADTSRKRIKNMLYESSKRPIVNGYKVKFSRMQLCKMQDSVWMRCGKNRGAFPW